MSLHPCTRSVCASPANYVGSQCGDGGGSATATSLGVLYSSNRDSSQSPESVVTCRGRRDASSLVSVHPGVSRRQWSQRSLSRSGDRTTQSSCPSKRHRIENGISTPPHYRLTPTASTDRLEQGVSQQPNRREETAPVLTKTPTDAARTHAAFRFHHVFGLRRRPAGVRSGLASESEHSRLSCTLSL
jgi:hypothetical protein